MIDELRATLADWRECGDLAGHVAAWLQVIRGQVTPGDRITPASDSADPPASKRPRLWRTWQLWRRLDHHDRALILQTMTKLVQTPHK